MFMKSSVHLAVKNVLSQGMSAALMHSVTESPYLYKYLGNKNYCIYSEDTIKVLDGVSAISLKHEYRYHPEHQATGKHYVPMALSENPMRDVVYGALQAGQPISARRIFSK